MSDVQISAERRLFVVKVPEDLGPVDWRSHRQLGARALPGAQIDDRYEVTDPDFEVEQLCDPAPDLMPCTFRYRTGCGPYLLAENTGGSLEVVADELTMQDALERLIDDACEDCGRYNADGEGYDGLCGDCADRAELDGRWD